MIHLETTNAMIANAMLSAPRMRTDRIASVSQQARALVPFRFYAFCLLAELPRDFDEAENGYLNNAVSQGFRRGFSV